MSLLKLVQETVVARRFVRLLDLLTHALAVKGSGWHIHTVSWFPDGPCVMFKFEDKMWNASIRWRGHVVHEAERNQFYVQDESSLGIGPATSFTDTVKFFHEVADYVIKAERGETKTLVEPSKAG